MRILSATDVAILIAHRTSELRYEERPSRLGGTYVAIVDSIHGVIEVADTMAEATQRVATVTNQAVDAVREAAAAGNMKARARGVLTYR